MIRDLSGQAPPVRLQYSTIFPAVPAHGNALTKLLGDSNVKKYQRPKGSENRGCWSDGFVGAAPAAARGIPFAGDLGRARQPEPAPEPAAGEPLRAGGSSAGSGRPDRQGLGILRPMPAGAVSPAGGKREGAPATGQLRQYGLDVRPGGRALLAACDPAPRRAAAPWG